jgi:hypothetical protein
MAAFVNKVSEISPPVDKYQYEELCRHIAFGSGKNYLNWGYFGPETRETTILFDLDSGKSFITHTKCAAMHGWQANAKTNKFGGVQLPYNGPDETPGTPT